MQEDFKTERLGPGSPSWDADSPSHLARYLFAAEYVQGKRVLDAGAGTGYGSLVLKIAGAAEVQGVDIDPSVIEQARGRFQCEGLNYLADDCEKLANVQGPFDVICNFENIEHLNRPEAFLENAARLLKDDGVLFCSTPDRATSEWEDGRPKNPFHTIEWYREEFQAILAKYFDDIDIRVEVEYRSVSLRIEAARNLTQHLTYLWASPLVRLSRVFGKLIGQEPPAWGTLFQLAAATPGDYRVVPLAIASLLGTPTSHFALCRKPRRP
jgi:SAM-dependent methyltransferase